MGSEKFYDQTAEFYDGMINLGKALERRTAQLKMIFSEPAVTGDFGCGTGLDSLSLFALEHTVTAFDNSQGMLDKAKKNAARYAAHIEFVKSSLSELPPEFNGKFDNIISLGNTLANLSHEELERTLNNASAYLKPGGMLLIQILNYDLIMLKQERIVNINMHGDQALVRFYDFTPEKLKFNILKFSSADPSSYELLSSDIYPHDHTIVHNLLISAGFQRILKFGSLNLDAFDAAASKDLIIQAWK